MHVVVEWNTVDEGDYVCVSCYASSARLVIEWTACDEAGKAALFEAIKGLKEEGSTNLTAGLHTGFCAFEADLPAAVAAKPSEYALLLAIATDGQPSKGTHPPGGPTGYANFVAMRSKAIEAMHGPAAVPSLVAIGLGNDLDSRLLSSFADTFLHMPDPGSVGSFMVNLLAATRATATTGALSAASSSPSAVGNQAVLRLAPASAVAAVPGFSTTVCGDEVHVPLGVVTYDQPRHVLVLGAEGASPLTATAAFGDTTIAACTAPTSVGADDASFNKQLERTAAVCALSLQEARLSIVDELAAPTDQVAARLAREGGRFGDVTISLLWNDQCDLDLHVFLPSGEEVFYSKKKSSCGAAELDIDMNAGEPRHKEPVENVFIGDAEKGVAAPLGKYKVVVHNYAYHSDEGLPVPRDVPFMVSVRMHGDTTEYTGVCTSSGQKVDVVEFEYTGRLASADEQMAMLREVSRKAAAEKARLRGVPSSMLSQAVELLSASPLQETLRAEALLAVQPAKFRAWGRHYLVTLPQMLRAERRSNFRDAALQSFGFDALGRAAFFGDLAEEAELCFAQLEPPKPSGLERIARQKAQRDTNASTAAARSAQSAYTTMPDEFMRGGGCFAPCALVQCVGASGDVLVPIAHVPPGATVRTASGATATVRFVVESPCADGSATLSELPSGLCLTEWHPVQDAHGTWRFPIMLGRRIVRSIRSVYNLVLSSEHVAIVGGTPCVTLGHGLHGPVVGHRFYGSMPAVLDELMRHGGADSGRVVLDAPLRALR